MIMLLPVLFLAGCSDSIVDLAPDETPLALTVDNQSLELNVVSMSKMPLRLPGPAAPTREPIVP